MLIFFQEWFKLKSFLHGKFSKTVFKQGGVWWCSVGMNVGEEVFGKGFRFTRPVLVFKKFTANSFLGLPLTRQEKHGSWYVEVDIHGRRNYVMLNQARILDKKRMTNRIAALDDENFNKVRERFLDFYDPEK